MPTKGKTVPIEYLDEDHVKGEIERIGMLRDEFPDTWRSMIREEIDEATKKVTTISRETQQKINFEKIKADLSDNELLNEVDQLMKSMPAPHDLEGMAKFREILRRHQVIIP